MSFRDPETAYRCAGECRQLLDEDEYRPRMVNGATVCPECCEMCEYCGEWLDDEQATLWGPLVRVTAYEAEHRYTAGHAYCVGQWILGLMAGIPRWFDLDDYSKEDIAAVYSGAALLEVAHA